MTGSQRQQQAIDRTSTFALRHKRGDEQSVEKIQDFCSSPQRRRLLLNNVATIGSAMLPIWGGFAHPCEARGLVQFPCDVPLANTYHLVRAGTSLLEEEEGIWSTNPLFLTVSVFCLGVRRKIWDRNKELESLTAFFILTFYTKRIGMTP
jgi:hypothetical protein